MVQIHRNASKGKVSTAAVKKGILLTTVLVITCVWLLVAANQASDQLQMNSYGETVHSITTAQLQPSAVSLTTTEQHSPPGQQVAATTCPYKSWNDLTEAEQHPVASATRHMITPPEGGNVTLVCCQTSAGPWSIAVHHKWAPIGARRFLDMVETNYFNDQQVPLMRCIRNFLCQFGLAGLASRQFKSVIPDELSNWLPEGPDHRQNAAHVKRFSKGYFAFAGARGGKHGSRTNQLIVALADNGPLAGGSPWEVPWGELVGEHSFATLKNVYTGYGEKGPKQALLHKEGALEVVTEQFPKLDKILSCHVVDSVVMV